VTPETSTLKPEPLAEVVIRFAGDSGDGMQLTGDRFTDVSAAFGNDLATLPNYPAEIRAPAGTIAGVSSFQVQISDHDILTPGDLPTVLVAMNPAALRANIDELAKGGTILVNSDAFDQRNLDKAGYQANPLEDGSLSAYRVIQVSMTSMTLEATKELGVKPRDAERSKNFFALGLISWLYTRPVEPTLAWIDQRFGNKELVRAANLAAFKAGYNFGDTAELWEHPYEIAPASLPPGQYRQITGNLATSLGLIAAGHLSKLPVTYASYPITPASDVLHELSRHKNFGVRTFQAEDEIAAIGVAIGAAFAGHLAVTGTSGPGVDLKSEAMGLAVSLELPLVILDVQRGGPSTGLPTKTEQADLLLAMYGRHGEAPMPIVAASTPSDCFDAAIEAARIALKYRTPVLLLTDGYLANGAEPWRLPAIDDLPDLTVEFATKPNHGDEYWPYLRDPETLARPWALPGTPGLMHRIGGIEKQDGTGNINYEAGNHEHMVRTRAQKVANIAQTIPNLEVEGDQEGDLLVIGWGGTYGSIATAVQRARRKGRKIGQVHFRYLNPFPKNTAEVFKKFKHFLVPELNAGQLLLLLRGMYLIDAKGLNKVQGRPFLVSEIEDAIDGFFKN